ncbi:MAG: prepilin peptidase [Bdellovibrionales bacterium]|nr:prepilin peptidase [Bdellovibrionales bacterium]
MYAKLPLIAISTELLLILLLWSLACLGAFVWCSYTDLRSCRIPNWITYPFLITTLLIASLSVEWLFSALLGGLVAATVFLIPIFLFGPEKAGMGDVKLAALGGLLLGPFYTVEALTISFLLAAIVLFPLRMLGYIKARQAIPFGPFIAFGFIVELVFLLSMVLSNTIGIVYKVTTIMAF